MRRIGGMLRLMGLVALLNGCAATLTTASGVAPDGHLMYAGTRLNSSIISQASCESGVPDNHGCAYDKVLAPLSVWISCPACCSTRCCCRSRRCMRCCRRMASAGGCVLFHRLLGLARPLAGTRVYIRAAGEMPTTLGRSPGRRNA